MTTNTSQTSRTLFWRFFSNYFWLGLVITLVAVVLDHSWSSTDIIKSVIIDLLKTVGISVMIAAIFSFASGTNEFINNIRKLLEKIVLQRDFLGNIDSISKRTALESLLQPSDDEKKIYSKIHEYYTQFIDEALSIGEKSIREGYVVNCFARYDPKLRRIAVESTYSYSLYRTKDGFKRISLGFEEGEENSTFDKLCIRDSNGKSLLEESNIPLNNYDTNGVKFRRVDKDVPQSANDETRLKIDQTVTEVGSDHWCLLTFNNLQPTNNFQLFLHCDVNVEIKKYSVFFVDAEYMVDLSTNRKKIHISTNQWINQGTGLAILLALPHTIPDDQLPNNTNNIAGQYPENSPNASLHSSNYPMEPSCS